MTNIVEFAIGAYIVQSSLGSNPVSNPEYLLDTLAGVPPIETGETGEHTWDIVFNTMLNLIVPLKRVYFPASYTSSTALDPGPDPATYTTYPIRNPLNIDRSVIISGDGRQSTIIEYANTDVINPAIRVLTNDVTLEHFKVSRSDLGLMQHGILLMQPATLKHIDIELAINDGIHILEMANGCQFYHVKSYRNARYGFYTEASNGVILGLDANANSLGAIIDQSFAGNNYVGCHTAGINSTSNLPISYQAKNGLFLGCFAENDQLAPKIDKPGIWMGSESEIPIGSGTILRGQTFYIQNQNRGIRFENRMGSIVDFTAGGVFPGVIFEFGANEDFQTGGFPFERLDKEHLDKTKITTLRFRFDLYRQLEELIDQRQKLLEQMDLTTDEEELAEINISLANNQNRKNLINVEIITVNETIEEMKIENLEGVTFGRWRLEFTPEELGEYNNWYRLRYYAQPMSSIPVLVPAEVTTGMAFSSIKANLSDNYSGHRLWGHVAFPRGFFMGKGSNRIKIDVANAAPDVPTTIGDIVFNSNPVVGSPIGWVCTHVEVGLAWRSFGEV
ncbi:MAG: hypothetical protein IPM47_07285 [Sphingobacteriales bacterium]|nr:MAG: hypothetical protein IPM47_07285 [Sphingobacteriales bacterium]